MVQLFNLSSDCDPACVGCMGSGAARCRKCASGYRFTGSKCLGKVLLRFCAAGAIPMFGRWCQDFITRLHFSLSGSDVDECSDRVLACHGLDEICTNTEGSFRCDCAEGFIRRDGVCVRRHQPRESHHTHTHTQTGGTRCPHGHIASRRPLTR